MDIDGQIGGQISRWMLLGGQNTRMLVIVATVVALKNDLFMQRKQSQDGLLYTNTHTQITQRNWDSDLTRAW